MPEGEKYSYGNFFFKIYSEGFIILHSGESILCSDLLAQSMKNFKCEGMSKLLHLWLRKGHCWGQETLLLFPFVLISAIHPTSNYTMIKKNSPRDPEKLNETSIWVTTISVQWKVFIKQAHLRMIRKLGCVCLNSQTVLNLKKKQLGNVPFFK